MSSTHFDAEQSLADDLIWGVDGDDGIAAFLGLEPQQVYYLIAKKKLRGIRKMGHRTIVASRSELRRQFSVEAA